MSLAASRPRAIVPVQEILAAFNRMFPDRAATCVRHVDGRRTISQHWMPMSALTTASGFRRFRACSHHRAPFLRGFRRSCAQDTPWQNAALPSFVARQPNSLLLLNSRPWGPLFDTYAEIFAERARSYHSAMEAFPRAREAEFRSVLEPFDGLPGGTLCDMPAGGGYLAHHLRPDLDTSALIPPATSSRSVQRRQSTSSGPNLTDVPLESGSVDYVVSLAGLHHEPDLGGVFREMRRLVREAAAGS